MNVNEMDFQKLHLAPKPVQFLVALVLAALMVVAGYFVLFQEQYENFQAAQTKEEELKTEYKNLTVETASLQILEQELQEIEQSIQALIKQLPVTSEIPSLIQELYQAASRNDLTMSTVVPKPPVAEDANIQRLPFTISVVGSYERLSQFLRDIGKMSRIVTLSNINISNPEDAQGKNKDKLLLKAVASTYKAVDAPPQAASDASGAASSPDAQ
ncbi:MAG: type 4a pilus biogenesis protein PilO [Conchiformibius sp.]|nr:type 4a pilus biogenesis protein PilO [Conchiformibius sp.]